MDGPADRIDGWIYGQVNEPDKFSSLWTSIILLIFVSSLSNGHVKKLMACD
jgi:hypothetical protein